MSVDTWPSPEALGLPGTGFADLAVPYTLTPDAEALLDELEAGE